MTRIEMDTPANIQEQLATPMDPAEKQKLLMQMVGMEIAQFARDGQTIVVGSGRTAAAATVEIGKLIQKNRWTIHAIPTSLEMQTLAERNGFIIKHRVGEEVTEAPDWGFDGADAVEEGTHRLIKGGGNAQRNEKIRARLCKNWKILVDETKCVPQLGEGKFNYIPIEVQPDKLEQVRAELTRRYNPKDIKLRERDGQITFTDSGNYNVHMFVEPGSVQTGWEKEIESIDGVVENGCGLFEAREDETPWASEIWIAHATPQPDGSYIEKRIVKSMTS